MRISIEHSVKLIRGIIENNITTEEIKTLTEKVALECDYDEYERVLEFVYGMSYYFLDKEGFEQIADYIRSKGQDASFYKHMNNIMSVFYPLWRYYRCGASQLYFGIILAEEPPLYMLPYMLAGNKEISEDIKQMFFNRNSYVPIDGFDSRENDFYLIVSELFRYAVTNEDIQIVDSLVCLSEYILPEYFLTLAVEHEDIFHGFFSQYHKEFLPDELLEADGRALPTDKLIGAFFYSTIWNRVLPKKRTVVSILCRLSKVIGVESLKKMEMYIPAINVINCYDYINGMEIKGLNGLLARKAADVILLKNVMAYDISELHWLKKFCGTFKKSRIYIEADNVFLFYNNQIIEDFLNTALKNNITVVSKAKCNYKTVENIISLNDEKVTSLAVSVGMLNKGNYDTALDTAVNKKSFASINALNKLYDIIQSGSLRRVALKNDDSNKRSYYYECVGVKN